MSRSNLVSLFVIKTGLLVIDANARGVLVEYPAQDRRPRHVEMVSWQDVAESV